MTSDPTKPLCVFESNGVKCGLSAEHKAHHCPYPTTHPEGFMCHPYTPPAETGRKNVGKYSMGYCCDGGSNGEKHSQDCRYNAAPVSHPLEQSLAALRAYAKSQKRCGDPATLQDLKEFRQWKNMPQDREYDEALLKEFGEVAPVSPEPPLNVRLKGDKDKGRFCIHGVELIKWCKICDGVAPRCNCVDFRVTGTCTAVERLREAGTAGVTPEPESKADQQWLHLVAKLNTIHAQLQHKPSHLKCGHRQEIGSILNAYREGDLSFDEAKLAAQSLPSPAPQQTTQLSKIRDIADEAKRALNARDPGNAENWESYVLYRLIEITEIALGRK